MMGKKRKISNHGQRQNSGENHRYVVGIGDDGFMK